MMNGYRLKFKKKKNFMTRSMSREKENKLTICHCITNAPRIGAGAHSAVKK